MAFVYRAERDLKPDSHEMNDTSPGSYELGSSFKSQEANIAPFNSLVKRNKNSFIPKTETPGPGTYEKEYMYIEEHKKIKNQKDINIYQAVENNVLPKKLVDLYKQRDKIAFNTRGERFNYTSEKLHLETNPGPGTYDISTSFSSMNNSNIKNKIKFNEYLTTGSIYRKSTIPSKENFGYEDTKEGFEKMIEDPEKDIKFTGEKNDTIGPGQYEIFSNWNTNVIKWKNTDKNNKKKSLSLSKEKNNNTFETNNKKDYRKNNDKTVLLKYYLNKRYNTSRAIKEKKDNSPTDFIFDATPGPGYYTQEIDTNWKVKKNSKGYLQSFDSTCPRFQEIKSSKNNLGPGYYYNFSVPKEKKIPIYKVGKLLGNNDKESEKKSAFNVAMTKQDTSNKVGPGSYDISGNLLKKKISNVNSFGIKERRFNYKIENDNNPGPGYYLGTNDNNNNNIDNNNEKNIPHLINKSLADNNEKKFVVEHFETPPIGSYNPGLVLSLNYKVQSNINTFQDTKKVGFGTQKKRFDYKESSDFLGPGLYYKSVSKDVKQNKAPFNENNQRFNYKNDKMPIPGPGSYELSNFNEWDKKSFNILFV